MDSTNRETSFRNTGAVEQDRPEQETNVAPLAEQLDHQYQDPLNKTNDSGMGNRGQTPEFTGEKEENNFLEQDTNAKHPNNVENEIKRADEQRMKKMDIPEHSGIDQNAQNFDSRVQQEKKKKGPSEEVEQVVDQDPGERQKENQNQKRDDGLAA